MSLRIAAFAGVLLLAACSSESGETTTVPDTTTTAPNPTTIASTTTAVEDSTTTTSGTDTTATGGFDMPALIVASEAGIRLVDGSDTSTLLDTPASVAVDDLMGGLVYQGTGSNGGFFGAPEESIVWWLPAGAEQPQSLLVPTGEQFLRLIGVELIDGLPTVVYIRSDNPGDFNNALDTLRLYAFDTGDVREVRTVGGWESGTSHVTFGGGIFASNWFGEAYSGFDFFDTNGDDIAVGGDPYGDAICFDGTIEPGTEDAQVASGRCFENVAISPDGARIAYTTLVSDDDGIVRSLELVVVDASDGSELRRVPVRTEEPFSITSLDIRGDTALYNQSVFVTEREVLPATVVDLASGRSAMISIPGTARFAPTVTGG